MSLSAESKTAIRIRIAKIEYITKKPHYMQGAGFNTCFKITSKPSSTIYWRINTKFPEHGGVLVYEYSSMPSETEMSGHSNIVGTHIVNNIYSLKIPHQGYIYVVFEHLHINKNYDTNMEVSYDSNLNISEKDNVEF